MFKTILLIRVGNAGRNEIGEVRFKGFDYQTRGAYSTCVEVFSPHFQPKF